MGIAVLMVQYCVTKTPIFATSWWRKTVQSWQNARRGIHSKMREFHNRLLFLDLRGRSRPQPYSLPCDEPVSPEQGRRTVPEVGRLLIGSEKVQKG